MVVLGYAESTHIMCARVFNLCTADYGFVFSLRKIRGTSLLVLLACTTDDL
jgi:hypothetical protein